MAESSQADPVKQRNSQGHSFGSYVLLVVGIISALIGMLLLLDIAVGLLLLFLGFTLINMFLTGQ